jgi:hypothetical protein
MELHFLTLLLVFQLKHLIADYYLQYAHMYENKGKKTGWVFPLAEHAGVHAVLTFLIVIGTGILLYPDLCGPSVLIAGLGLPLFDFITHFIIDRWKAVKPYGPDNARFWVLLGQDQMLHHIVGILISYYIVYLIDII